MTALRKLTWIELKLFAREPFSLVFTFGFPLVVLTVLTASFQPGDEAFGDAMPADYYLASYVGVVIGAFGLIILPAHLAAYRERGILRRFRASSVPASSALGSQLAVGLAVATLASALLVVVGTLAYDAQLPVQVGLTVLGFLLAAASFMALGLLLATLLPGARAAQAVGMILFFPMWLLSGAGPPPEIMGATMRGVSDAMPLTWAVQAVQSPWLGEDLSATSMLLLAAMLLVAGAVAIRRFRSA